MRGFSLQAQINSLKAASRSHVFGAEQQQLGGGQPPTLYGGYGDLFASAIKGCGGCGDSAIKGCGDDGFAIPFECDIYSLCFPTLATFGPWEDW